MKPGKPFASHAAHWPSYRKGRRDSGIFRNALQWSGEIIQWSDRQLQWRGFKKWAGFRALSRRRGRQVRHRVPHVHVTVVQRREPEPQQIRRPAIADDAARYQSLHDPRAVRVTIGHVAAAHGAVTR